MHSPRTISEKSLNRQKTTLSWVFLADKIIGYCNGKRYKQMIGDFLLLQIKKKDNG